MNRSLLIAILLLLTATSMFAQGVQTATLQGTVTDQGGAPLPGVTVTVKSPALMGERSAQTTGTGDYIVKQLPPGDYTITFSLEGMTPNTVRKNLPLGLTTVVDAKMKVAAVTEAITVTASAPTVLETNTVGANIKAETVQQLPVGRAPVDIAQLSPGVTGDRGGRTTTPVGGQLSINGAMAYDNNFLINGVNFQDNIFGNTNNLFIEDAIQETQVLTSGISAEYGHFTGGVVNVITKSGGNQLSGSYRDNLNKGSWLRVTPWERGYRGEGADPGKPAPHTAKLSHIHEATLGGPIMRDRLWFFGALRMEKSSTPQNLTLSGYPWTLQVTNKRPELKLTANLGSGHTLQGDYIDNPVKRNLEVQVTPLVFSALGKNSSRPNKGYSAFYSGVLATTLFGEARYSKKHFGFRGVGGTLTDIVNSPMRSSTRFTGVTVAGTYNAPFFDANDPEDRDNKQWFGALSYFFSRPRFGSHDIKGGYERFDDIRMAGNSQTATDYVFTIAYKTVNGSPVFDSNGELIPVFNPRGSGANQDTRMRWYQADRGARIDDLTNSLFINDRWTLNQYFNFNVGLRYEKATARTKAGLTTIDTSNLVPRLGASYDPMGNGRYKFDVTYAQYVGRYNPSLAARATSVGNPSSVYGYYIGPKGEGRNFAPGFDINNYKFYSGNVPTANVSVAKGMHAPVTKEWTFSSGFALPKSGWFKATFTDRKFTDFIEDFITLDNGFTAVTFRGVKVTLDNVMFRNSKGPKREYQALELQSHYDLLRNWSVEGNVTHQFKNHGNFEGESGQSITASPYGDRPEMQSPREFPYGRLAQFEENRVRLWTNYGFNLRRAGRLTTGLLWRYDSPLTFSYSRSIARSSVSTSKNPGYKSVGSSVTMFWGDRGAGEYKSTSLWDASFRWDLPIMRVTPWVKFDVKNLFHKQEQIFWDTTVNPDPNSPLDDFGYRTGFVKASTFGRPTANGDFIRPREYVAAVGVRF